MTEATELYNDEMDGQDHLVEMLLREAVDRVLEKVRHKTGRTYDVHLTITKFVEESEVVEAALVGEDEYPQVRNVLRDVVEVAMTPYKHTIIYRKHNHSKSAVCPKNCMVGSQRDRIMQSSNYRSVTKEALLEMSLIYEMFEGK